MPFQNTGQTRHRPELARCAPWLPAAIWAYLALGRGRYWSTSSRLPPSGTPVPEFWPPVAVVVPARDESALLPRTLPTLLAQDYPGRARIVLVDDQSTDGTAQLARKLASQGGGRGLGLRIVPGTPRPAGWAGKPWAMAQGVQEAMSGPNKPEWLLFTDADISHPPSSLRHLVSAALADHRAGVSLMARLSTEAGWERLLMPAFVYYFAQIYPFEWVNDRRRRTAAAAGGCFLVRADALCQVGGVEAIAGSTIDDIALAKVLKEAGYDIWLGLAGDGAEGDAPRVESLRSYRVLDDIWKMVARNAYTQLRHNPAALAGALAALTSIYLSPPLLAGAGLATKRPALAVAGLGTWTAMAATYRPMVKYYGASPTSAWALPFTSCLYMAMTLSSALRHHKRGAARTRRQPG
jgi:hopene-associated glycosyltransferase HpnB